MKRFFWFALLVASAYLVMAYWPAARNYFLIRYAVQEVAGLAPNGQWSAVGEMITQVEEDTGIRMSSTDIRIFVDEEGQRRVAATVWLPVEFPFTEIEKVHEVTVSATAAKVYGEH